MAGLKDIFKTTKGNGYIIPKLDEYLFKKSNEPNDRAINVNAPSQAGNCIRANYYIRMGIGDCDIIQPRTQRIFDNGTYVHLRLQDYLTKMGVLIIDEVPLINEEFNIQGHTDGYLDLDNEVAILEIKSINEGQFKKLDDAKPEHKRQGLIYLFCAEERRKFLHENYKDRDSFFNSECIRESYFRRFYQHMQDGNHYTREEKIQNEVDLNLISDDILYDTNMPLTKVIFLYECKNTQELKEFVLELNSRNSGMLNDILTDYKELNKACEEGNIPDRQGTSKSCNTCKWCGYKNECWVV